MRFEIERDNFIEMLIGMTNALPSRTTYPILTNAVVEVTGNQLAVSATDLDTHVRRTYRLDGEVEDGKAVLPGKKMFDIVRESKAGRLSFQTKGLIAQLRAGAAKASFSGLDPAEFPLPPAMPQGVEFDYPLATLLELYDLTGYAASKDESRPAMTGLNWEVSKTETRMVATDGHRLALVTRKGKFGGKLKAIVGAKVFGLFPRGEEKVIVRADPGHIAFVFENATVISRLIEGPYPDYERVVPKDYPVKAKLDVAAFTSVLRRASVFAHPVGRPTALSLAPGKLVLSTSAPDVGEFEEELDCEYAGEPIRIGFNCGFLLELLRRMTGEKVVLELSNPLAAGVLRPAEPKPDTDETYIVMPIRLE